MGRKATGPVKGIAELPGGAGPFLQMCPPPFGRRVFCSMLLDAWSFQD